MVNLSLKRADLSLADFRVIELESDSRHIADCHLAADDQKLGDMLCQAAVSNILEFSLVVGSVAAGSPRRDQSRKFARHPRTDRQGKDPPDRVRPSDGVHPSVQYNPDAC
jgi:hypothetical protein